MYVTSVQRGGVEVVDQVATEWRALCDEGPYDEPFYRPEWVRAYASAFGRGRRLVVITARQEERLRAILPLVEDTGLIQGMPARSLRAAASIHSCRFDLVHGMEDEHESAVAAIWSALKQLPGWDVLVCNWVPAGGALPRLVSMAKAEGYPTAVRQVLQSPYVRLPGNSAGIDAVLAGVDTRFRANLRRRRRQLSETGAVSLAMYTGADRAVLDDFYRLEQAGWKGRQGTAIACDPRVRQFYDTIAMEAERFGYLALYALQRDGQPVAMHYGLAHRGRYYLLKPAYDEALGRYSPGQLLVHEVLQDLASKACREFDFLGPSMEWKRDWTQNVRRHDCCYVFNNGWIGRSLHLARFRAWPEVRHGLRAARALAARQVNQW